MGVIAKYKFNQNVYADFIPEFNSGFTNYTIIDEIDADGFTIRTIESDSLPTLMRFGAETQTDREKSLLIIYECNTQNITSMSNMFYNCTSLTSLDVSSFNTDNTTNMSGMFCNCTKLTSLDLSNFNTDNVTDMALMFNNCSSLTSLDLSNFDTSKVLSTESMFSYCYKLKSLKLPLIVNSDLLNMSFMFNSCISLTLLDLSNWDTSKVVNMQYTFNNCSSLTSLDVSNFNTEKVTNMSGMFSKCSLLTSLDVSNFDTSQVTRMDSMFDNCSSLTSLDVSSFNTSKVTNMGGMFYGCSSLISLDLSNFNTSKVTNMDGMFASCSSLISLDVSNFNTSQVTTMGIMFYNCSSLTSLDVSNFYTSQVKNMGSMFQNCSSLTSLNVSNFDTSNVTDITQMFYDCSLLTSLNVSGLDTSKVIGMGGIFYNCSKLTSLDVSNFNTNQVTTMNSMFANCSSLTSLDVSNFDTGQVTDMNHMFDNTKNLKDTGAVYCNSLTINKISDLITTDTTIWYSDAKLEDLTKKENITYKEYKMNILESDEEIKLRRIGDVYDELDLVKGIYTQRIEEVTFDGSETFRIMYASLTNEYRTFFVIDKNNAKPNSLILCNKYIARKIADSDTVYGYIFIGADSINVVEEPNLTLEQFKARLKSKPLKIQYELATPVIKTINLKNKPSINWQGDTYLHLENNTLYPQLDCEIESINYYEIPKLKANTLYTLRYVGEPTQCIFGGLTYKTKNNMILTSGSSDNLLYFDKEVRKVILIEGDARDRNFDYFEGIESLGAVEIVTHKTNMPIFAKGGRK